MARRPLVMGNWKLNGSKAFTKELIEGLKAELHDVTGCDVAIAPPVMYLGTAEAALSGCGCSCGGKSVIQLGAQNVDINVKGAFTGDISSEMLKDLVQNTSLSVTLSVVLTTKKTTNSSRKNLVY